jgi:hypothetical protein
MPSRQRIRVWLFRGLVAVLSGTIVVGVWWVASSIIGAKTRASIRMETRDLARALEAYKSDTGEYPPDFTHVEEVSRHLRKVYPQYDGPLPAQFADLDPASALTFWLGGMTDSENHLIGFSANATNPFDQGGKRRGPYYEFDPQRLKKVGGGWWYLPSNGKADSEPYLYFRDYTRRNASLENVGAWRGYQPGRDPRTDGYARPNTFQIRCPGLDGRFGRGTDSPDGKDDVNDYYIPVPLPEL